MITLMKLTRFTKTERLLHWSFAIPTVMLALSGLTMVVVSLFELNHIIKKSSIVTVHVTIGFILITLPLMVFFGGDRRIVLKDVKEILHLSRKDISWIFRTFLWLFLRHITLPPQGKFNGGQKINTVLTLFLVLGLSLTGLTILIVKGSLLANIIHVILFFIFLSVFPGHLYLALINPSTRPAIRAITTGRINAEWLKEHHTLMYEEIAKYIYGNIVFEKLTYRKDKKQLYKRAYSQNLSFKDFKKIIRGSELVIVAKKDDELVGFVRIIGDKVRAGVVVEGDVFEDNEMYDKMIKAAQMISGHPVSDVSQDYKIFFSSMINDKEGNKENEESVGPQYKMVCG